jgi:hypothetical protein
MAQQLPGLYAGMDTTLQTALSYSSLILSYDTFSAAGTQSVLIPSQVQATPRQYLMLGNGTIDMTSAIATAIVKDPNGQPNTSPLESQRANLATGMVTYFTNIPAAADAAYCYAFAVGGLVCSDVVEIVLRNYRRTSTSAVNPSDNIKNILAATPIGGPSLTQPGNQQTISLNGSNQILLRDGTTALTYGTHTVVVCPAYGVIFGALAITDVTDAANAGDLLELEIRFK